MGGSGESIEELRAGMTLGRYELLVPIAAGGMARVWAARLVGQGGFSKIVALKTILPDFADHLQFRQMFLDEARIAAKLRHPHVCETFDLGEENGALYLTMEWIEGPSLLRIVKVPRKDAPGDQERTVRRAIDPRVGARIIADACAGLHAAHELLDDDGTRLDVIHRDVSPHNILLSSSGVVKVTDFGVAKARGRRQLTTAGEIKGKVAYMAPEQLVGSATLDARCDVFGLGCVLYEITTGRRAFPGTAEGEIVSAILTGTIKKPRELDPGYPEPLEQILMRSLARDAHARHPTAAALAKDLEAWLSASGPPITAETLAALAREAAGEETEAMREKIRVACAIRPAAAPHASDAMRAKRTSGRPSGRPSGVDRSEKAVAIDTDPSAGAPARQSRKVVASAAAALAIASAVFVGAAWYALSRAETPLASASPSGPPRSGLVAPPTSVVTPLPLASLRTLDAPPSARITFRLTPKNAYLVVEGVVMPAGIDTVQRPSDGRSIRVVVRADKHEDQAVTIDANAPAELDVALSSRTTTGKGPRGPKAAPSASAAPKTDALPNPYE